MNSDNASTGSAALPEPRPEASQLSALTGVPQTAPGDQSAIAAQPMPDLQAPAEEDSQMETVWIEKAKQIIASTRDDPYKQSQALAALKVEYLQKRYNKTVQISS